MGAGRASSCAEASAAHEISEAAFPERFTIPLKEGFDVRPNRRLIGQRRPVTLKSASDRLCCAQARITPSNTISPALELKARYRTALHQERVGELGRTQRHEGGGEHAPSYIGCLMRPSFSLDASSWQTAAERCAGCVDDLEPGTNLARDRLVEFAPAIGQSSEPREFRHRRRRPECANGAHRWCMDESRRDERVRLLGRCPARDEPRLIEVLDREFIVPRSVWIESLYAMPSLVVVRVLLGSIRHRSIARIGGSSFDG